MGAGHSRRTREQSDRASEAERAQAAQQPRAQDPPPNYPTYQPTQPHPYYSQGGVGYGGYGGRQFMPNNGQFYGGFPQQYMAYQQQMRQQQQQQAPVEQTQKTNTIRNDVNLKKTTLKVHEQEPGVLTVSFTFDAAAPCSVSVFFLCSEDTNERCTLSTTLPGSKATKRLAYDKGLAHEFKQASEDGLTLADCNPHDLENPSAEVFPVVVRLETIRKEAPNARSEYPEPPGSALPLWVQAQTTYANITKNSEGEYSVRVLKQKIWVEGVSYELQEIYGIDQSSGSNSADDVGKECVICMTEPRDTTVLPSDICACAVDAPAHFDIRPTDVPYVERLWMAC
eukprot:CAMPEP_0197855160 /NCGR_PEP_ID=MMETSP1438-20131217/26106_1 /TAXON_ID=1461541 /ORGANISM="Pterosperma sp., Strain CCMP1384" /LENGTH=339 /DNA_ID=CAMNT_0043470165 /DNA_START=251 /DNA_END=1271 /DNA_ORIENTATION=-